MIKSKYFSKVTDNDIPRRKELFGSSGGVYILRSGDSSSPKPISRVCGIDRDGILYIGKSSTLSGGRVSELKKSLSSKHSAKGHQAGIRYLNNKILTEMFPFESLNLELIASEDAATLETELLSKYVAKFGEVPPLNRIE